IVTFVFRRCGHSELYPHSLPLSLIRSLRSQGEGRQTPACAILISLCRQNEAQGRETFARANKQTGNFWRQKLPACQPDTHARRENGDTVVPPLPGSAATESGRGVGGEGTTRNAYNVEQSIPQ